MEGVQDGGGVGELGVQGCLVAAERVQRGDLDAVAERCAAFGEPVGVGLVRPARDQVQQPGPQPPAAVNVAVAGQIDHACELLGAAGAGVGVVGRLGGVLIDAERGHCGEAALILGEGLQAGLLHRAPQRLPGHARPTDEAGDAGVLAAQLLDGPGHGTAGQRSPRRDHAVGGAAARVRPGTTADSTR